MLTVQKIDTYHFAGTGSDDAGGRANSKFFRRSGFDFIYHIFEAVIFEHDEVHRFFANIIQYQFFTRTATEFHCPQRYCILLPIQVHHHSQSKVSQSVLQRWFHTAINCCDYYSERASTSLRVENAVGSVPF